mgnify:CR=1 FL=1
MARPARTLEEQLEIAQEELIKAEEKVVVCKQRIIEIKQAIEDRDMRDVYSVLKESGMTVDEFKSLLEKSKNKK